MTMRLTDRPCPVCGPGAPFSVEAESNFDPAKMTAFSYASRKLPELMHHRLLRCGRCDALYASPAPRPGEVAKAYAAAEFDSGEEAGLAAATYAGELLARPLASRDGALDIGTGEGAFLGRLLEAGFTGVRGVEPSRAPIAAAAPSVRRLIRRGMFRASDYRKKSLGLVTCFQTLEHLEDPLGVCKSALGLLRPGGAFFTVCHNQRSLSAALMGRRSPIYDIEHFQLFTPASLGTLLRNAGFGKVRVWPISNRYPLRYWARVFPFPAPLKRKLLELAGGPWGSWKLPLRAGNQAAIGYRP
jgi:SAM-dependent methyltransferase